MVLKPFFKIASTKPVRQKGVTIEYDKPGDPYCRLCGLDKTCRWPKMEYTGGGKKGILAWAEASGHNEEIKGEQLVGEAGKALEKQLKPLGIDLHQDCWLINSVGCRPTEQTKDGVKNRKPTNNEITCCRPMVLQAVEELKPKYIWLFGGVACDSFFMGRFQDRGITRWRKWAIPDRLFNCWVIPMYHPSNLVRREGDQHFLSTFKRDLKFAVNQIGTPFPEPLDWQSQSRCLYDLNEIIPRLQYILHEKPDIFIDYETTGIKPFRPNHHIRVIGVDDGKLSTAFPYDNPYWNNKGNAFKRIQEPWVQILKDPEIKKSAHHMQFENMWSRVKENLDKIEGWDRCTLQGAHLLDSRKHITGLKFQAYIKFGIYGYDTKIAPYLEGGEYNDIDDAPLDDLLLYCNGDCVTGRELKKVQQIIFNSIPSLKRAYNDLWHDGALALSNMQIRGIPADEQYYIDRKEAMTKRIDRITNILLEGEEAKLYRKTQGKQLSLNSPKEIGTLLFTILKHKPTKLTSAEKRPSVDVEALEKMDIPFVQNLLRSRKLKKIRDTYMAQFLREIHEGRMHPNGNLHLARTYRSSNSKPNFQNIPVIDELAKKTCRSGIVPSPGRRLWEPDYKGNEVCMAACYSEDPVLIKEVEDPKADMHRDCGSDIFLAPKADITEAIRFFTKNQWTFPEFYTSYYKNCAPNMWNTVVEGGMKLLNGTPVKEHLRSKGINTLDRFITHCGKYEKEFWDKFKVFKKWQDKAQKLYLEKGYVEMFFGHRRTGWLQRGEVINTPIQGAGFHCLLWSVIQIDYISEYEDWETDQVAQIHDSGFFDLEVEEQNMAFETFEQVATKEIREKHKWIIVPLTIDHEVSRIDGSWYEMEKVKWNDKRIGWEGIESKKVYDENY